MNKKLKPSFIFEISWEVCNKVGGIYTVLSTKAESMAKVCPNVFFIGPDLGEQSDIYFIEKEVFPTYRFGIWNIAAKPNAILVSWKHLYESKNAIYGAMWEKFGIESHAAYGDYDDSSLFSYAAGQVVEEFCSSHHLEKELVLAHANEWQTAFFLFYLKVHCPHIATIFTTHATCIGRSIAGNGKPLYDYFNNYDGDIMAKELNLVSKHSAEKHAAIVSDCFTTVSQITGDECKQLLNKKPNVITPNGFNGKDYKISPKISFEIKKCMIDIAQKATEKKYNHPPFLICTSGRLEWHNKGYDVFIDSLILLNKMIENSHKELHIIAFMLVPYLVKDPVLLSHVSIISIPYYIDGHSIPQNSIYAPLLTYNYYEVLSCMDVSLYPSYYEPWGYTPQESCALSVPTITTSLAGFGSWVKKYLHKSKTTLMQGVGVVERYDSNTSDVVFQIANQLYEFFLLPSSLQQQVRNKTKDIGANTTWQHFFEFYEDAYDLAFHNNTKRS